MEVEYDNWQISYEKWNEIVERTESKTMWDGIFGWKDLKVVSGCGYCEQYLDGEDDEEECRDCPLFEEKYCAQDQDDNTETVFWQYVAEMRKENPDWERAIELAKKMLERIEQDRPGRWKMKYFDRLEKEINELDDDITFIVRIFFEIELDIREWDDFTKEERNLFEAKLRAIKERLTSPLVESLPLPISTREILITIDKIMYWDNTVNRNMLSKENISTIKRLLVKLITNIREWRE